MNETQALIAELIKRSDFNSFSGAHCVNALIASQHLWKGFMWGRFGHSPLICLRDIEYNDFNADTLYITPKPSKENELELFILRELSPDECSWESASKAAELLGSHPQTDKSLLRCWWD